MLPEDVGHRQGDAHVSGNITQPLVKLLKLLKDDTEKVNKIKQINMNKGDLFNGLFRIKCVRSAGMLYIEGILYNCI